jgi:outer membrane protein TolC
VLDAEKTLLTNEIAEVQTRQQRYVSTRAALIQGARGGLDADDAAKELAGEPEPSPR